MNRNADSAFVIQAGENEKSQLQLFELTEVAQTDYARIKEIKRENKKFKEMLGDILKNDPEYQDAVEDHKESTRFKNAAKKKVIASSSQAADLEAKIKDNAEALKITKDQLNDDLKNFVEKTGLEEIELEEGKLKKIAKKFTV